VDGITTIAQAQAAFGSAAGTALNSSGQIQWTFSNTAGRRRVNTGGPTGTGFADVFYLTNSSKGEGQFVTFDLHRPMKNHWGWSVSYTAATPRRLPR